MTERERLEALECARDEMSLSVSILHWVAPDTVRRWRDALDAEIALLRAPSQTRNHEEPQAASAMDPDELRAEVTRLREERDMWRPRLIQQLRAWAQHKPDCAKWGPEWEYPRHLHNEIACTCELPVEAK